MNAIPAAGGTARFQPPSGTKPLFKEGETPTQQDSVFFRRGDGVQSDDWSCHLERFKNIQDKDHPDYMPRVEGLTAAAAATAVGVATSLVTLPYAFSVAGPLLVGTTMWANGKSDSGLLSTIGEQFTMPVVGASKAADVVFEKVAGAFYEGKGPTISLHQDQEGIVWGVPKNSA